ncbi:uncharacterized protein CC84DRAFT_1172028 [Paraphaeosphaeria sporulosa]|uniref:Protein kinase domain-containing protein n=1 Tax=Paraphaeosphaeria sporulosa TaxID=1460663 RepID=A0A177CQ71_9PLEO|nr:uncharacterized protein CC84DRAFT_1172028 [Paraphaeosphaeria sporulosa]OAG09456.1 hypothetical protein CC84DRAFT_1172028 [Paraphaeosphaeria sporulosa]
MATNQAASQDASPMYILNNYPHDKYHPLSVAGSGALAMVYFSVSNQDYDALGKTKSTNTFDELRTKLVAVKVYATMPSNCAELEALQTIQESAGKDSHRLLASLVDYGTKWVATKAITPSLSVYELQNPTPEALILHTLLEMMRVCHVLYDGFETPMIHGDLHPGNMLIDAGSQTEFGLPGIVVIDFDQTKSAGGFEEAWEHFCMWARLLLSMLNRTGYGTPIEGWDQINDYLFSSASQASFEGMCGAIQSQLAKSLASLIPESVHLIGQSIRVAAAKKEANLRLVFQQAGLLG